MQSSSSLPPPGGAAVLAEKQRRHIAILKWITPIFLAGLLWLILAVSHVGGGRSEAIDGLLLQRASVLAKSPGAGWMTPVARFISLIGNWQFIVPIGVSLLVMAWWKRLLWRDFFLYLLAVAGTSGLTLFFKYVVGRPRQELVPTLDKAPFQSFPSGHTVFALVIYGYLAHLVLSLMDSPPRWLTWLLYGLAAFIAVAVGLSRIYLAAHYPTDVVAGLLIGVPWLLAVVALHNRYVLRDERR
jgi:membrane-associated phospholipid phosphatase